MRTLEEILKKEKGLKVNSLYYILTLYITFKKRTIVDGEEFYEFKNFHSNSKTFTITNIDQILDKLDQASEEIINRIAGWISEGSGRTIEKILSHHVNISKYTPIGGSSYYPFQKSYETQGRV